MESFDYKTFKEGSEGLKVALVHHLDMPIMRQTGFHISPGTENQIAITPTLLSTTQVRKIFLTYLATLKFVQGDPNQNLPSQIAIILKMCIFDPFWQI